MPREILVHLNVFAADTDKRTANEIADAIMFAIEVGSDDDSVRDLKVIGTLPGDADAVVCCPLAEEV